MDSEPCLVVIFPDTKNTDDLRELWTDVHTAIRGAGGELHNVHPTKEVFAVLVGKLRVTAVSAAIAPACGNGAKWLITPTSPDYAAFGLSASDGFLRTRLPRRGTPRG